MNITSEWALIKKIKKMTASLPSPGSLVAGIGDDCSIFKISKTKYGLISTDISIENVHFNKKFSSPEEIGYKAMVGNLSDIAAMGGLPLFAYVSIGIPKDLDEQFILKIYKGLIKAAKKNKTYIAGGDTSRSNEIIINISIYGETEKNYLIRREGTNIGDKIFITGHIGDSMAGLEILKNTIINKKYSLLVNKHKKPEPRIFLSRSIINKFSPTAMIDVSDGLLSDLSHICENSGKGFLLDAENLPVSKSLIKYCLINNKNIYDYALNSGEEYELLFTAKHDQKINKINGVIITQIGEIIKSGYLIKNDNIKKSVKISGYDHFSRQ